MKRTYSHFDRFCLAFAGLALILNVFGLTGLAQGITRKPNRAVRVIPVPSTVTKVNALEVWSGSANGSADEVGRITKKDGKWVFEGDIDKSVEIFLASVNRTNHDDAGRGKACHMGDVLEALISAESLFVPTSPEDPVLLDERYPGAIAKPWYYVTLDAIGVMDYDKATPEELRQLAKAREEKQEATAKENERIKERTAQRNAAAKQIREMLAACGVKVAITTPSIDIASGDRTRAEALLKSQGYSLGTIGTCGGCGEASNITLPSTGTVQHLTVSEQGTLSTWQPITSGTWPPASSSFPAIKRNGKPLEERLVDDSEITGSIGTCGGCGDITTPSSFNNLTINAQATTATLKARKPRHRKTH